MIRRWTLCLAGLALVVWGAVGSAERDGQQPEVRPAFETFTIAGRIVWLNEALERRFGIQTVPEAREQIFALETDEGELFPIAEDIRGRALRRDERLRQLKRCQLVVRRYRGSPVVQIIRMFEVDGRKRYELDYYCDVCAITMFELKACDCCQGPIRLRRREVPAEVDSP